MADHASIIKPVRATGVVVALLPPALFVLASSWAWASDLGLPLGVAVYLFYRLVIVRRLVCRDHRLGISLTRRGRFEEAVAAFRRSEAFWAQHPVLDRFRGPVLGSAMSHSFHVFALHNQAYCLARLGRGDEAQAILDRVLSTHPDMLQARELRDVMTAKHSVNQRLQT